MGPAERADVIVDFTGIPAGTKIRVVNTAPDAPFGGFPDAPSDPATTGQVIEFHVIADDPATVDNSTPPAQLRITLPDLEDWKDNVTVTTRDLALLEEESALICVFVDVVTGEITQDTTSVPPTCDSNTGSVPFGPMAAVLGVNGRAGGVLSSSGTTRLPRPRPWAPRRSGSCGTGPRTRTRSTSTWSSSAS
jgi:hypothetical protein